MSEKFQGVWPPDAPTSLWSYELLRSEQRNPLPFMGVHLEWNFVLAFLFGSSLIALFAWQRFSQRSAESADLDYEVIKKLAPTELRESSAVRQAYVYYAGILLSIYAALTFFGGLIFKAINAIPMAGLQAEVDQNTFVSPTWPLVLAIGMAGFAPMLKPLEIAETWLRRRVHGWVGIPLQIKDRTRRFLVELDRQVDPLIQTGGSTEGKHPATKLLEDRVKERRHDLHGWIEQRLQKRGIHLSFLRKLVELDLMLDALANPGSWPEIQVLDQLQALVRDERTAAEHARLSLTDLSKTEYPNANRVPFEPETEEQRENRLRLTRQLETMLDDTVAKIERARLELAAILAVYAERSPYRELAPAEGQALNEPLKSAVSRISGSRARVDTGFWLLVCLFPSFALYALMTTLGLHSPLTEVEFTATTIFATATMETLQVAALFWLPAVAVLALREYMVDTDTRRRLGMETTNRQSAERMIYYVAVAGVVAAIALVLLAMLWMALIADNTDRFVDLLYVRNISAFSVMIPKGICSCVFAFLLIRAADSSARARETRYPVSRAVASAIVTTTLLLLWNLAWQSGCLTQVSCAPVDTLGKQFVTNWSKGGLIFFRYYNITDYLVYFTVVFVAVFNTALPAATETRVESRKIKPKKKASEDHEPSSETAPVASAASVFTVALFISFAMSGTAIAGQTGPIVTGPVGPTIVRVGFRADAEPFSYKAGPSDALRYRGYIADLCYSIFAGSKYQIVEVEITATDRFDSFLKKQGTPSSKKKIDILCDPTTVRFWRNAERVDGIFSPIVFVTGVSYLVRRVGDAHAGTDLAFVDGTTARSVAERTCVIDMFGVMRAGGKAADCENVDLDCRAPANTEERRLHELPPKMRLCGFRSHDALLEWFCVKGKAEAGRQLVYFGDREIIHAKLDSWDKARGCQTKDVEREAPFYTYEPYALLVDGSKPELAQFVQRRVYDFFSHRSKAISLFTSYFPDVQMSPMMANLFLLNAVDEVQYDTVPSHMFDDDGG